MAMPRNVKWGFSMMVLLIGLMGQAPCGAAGSADQIMSRMQGMIDEQMKIGAQTQRFDLGSPETISAFAAEFVPSIIDNVQPEVDGLEENEKYRVYDFMLGLLAGARSEARFKDILARLPADRQGRNIVKVAEELAQQVQTLPDWLIALVKTQFQNSQDQDVLARSTAILLAQGQSGGAQATDGGSGEKNGLEPCRSNLRCLDSAIDMAQMDGHELPDALNLEEFNSLGYFQQPLVCPDGGEYSYNLEKENLERVSCSVHGPGTAAP